MSDTVDLANDGPRSEITTKLSADEFVRLADNIPFVVARIGRDRRHRFVNGAITRFTGKLPSETIGKTNEELGTPPEIAARWNSAIDEALAGTEGQVVFDWLTPDGPRVFVGRVIPERSADGSIDSVLCITRDITPERKAEAERARLLEELEAERAELRLANRRFRLALQGSPVSLFEQDRDLRFTWLHNPDPSLELTIEGVLGTRDSDFFENAEDAAVTMAIKREVLESGVGRRREVRLRARGADHYYELLVEPLRAADGQVTGVTCASVNITERKRMEAERAEFLRKALEDRIRAEELAEALAEKTRLLEAVLENAPLGIVILDAPKGRVALKNRAFEEVWGGRAPESVDEFAQCRIWKEDGTPWAADQSTLTLALHGVTSTQNVRLQRPDGTERWLHVAAGPVRDDSGQIFAAVLLFEDISEQVELTAARVQLLKQVSEERATLNALIHQLPVAASVYAPPDFRIEMINEAYQAFVPGRDIVGKTVGDAFPDLPMESTRHILSEVRRLKEPIVRREYAVLLKGPDGQVEERYFTSTFRPLLDDAGQVSRVVATSVDVTQEVRARAAIAESAERLRVILDEMPLGVVVRHAITGDVVLRNKASTEILGLDVTGLERGGPWRALDARHPDGRALERDDHAFRRAMRTGEAVRNQLVRFRHADGNEVVVRSSAALIGGDQTGGLVVSVFDDVTEEHRLLSEREQTARLAEMFVGILGHDLRAPLNVVTLAVSLLEHQGRLEAGDLKRVRQIGSSARRMTRMVEQLLDLTRARLAGGIPVERKPADLVVVIAAVLDELATANPGVTFHNDLPIEMTGEWDADRLAQVASNLLGNAIEHGDPARPIEISLESAGDTAIFAVHSKGPQIPEDLLPLLFDPFRRGVPSSSATSKGLGLGLYITREIVKAHGGDVRVTSSAEGGTTFVVMLPRFGGR